MKVEDRYFFDVLTGSRSLVDAYGIVLGGDDQACLEADEIAFKLLEEEGPMPSRRTITVTTRSNRANVLYRVSIETERNSPPFIDSGFLGR